MDQDHRMKMTIKTGYNNNNNCLVVPTCELVIKVKLTYYALR